MGRKIRSARLNARLAVALRHQRGSGTAPKVVAAGRGLVADRIVALAGEHGVPVHKEPTLAESLEDVGVGQPIPEELFSAVAKVLAFLYRVDGRLPRR